MCIHSYVALSSGCLLLPLFGPEALQLIDFGRHLRICLYQCSLIWIDCARGHTLGTATSTCFFLFVELLVVSHVCASLFVSVRRCYGRAFKMVTCPANIAALQFACSVRTRLLAFLCRLHRVHRLEIGRHGEQIAIRKIPLCSMQVSCHESVPATMAGFLYHRNVTCIM